MAFTTAIERDHTSEAEAIDLFLAAIVARKLCDVMALKTASAEPSLFSSASNPTRFHVHVQGRQDGPDVVFSATVDLPTKKVSEIDTIPIAEYTPLPTDR
jgi:hypothetical protein